MGWVVWMVAAALLAVGEMHQGGFYLLPFAVGAAVAGLAMLVGVGLALSVVLFAAVAGVIVVGLRPVAQRHRRLPPAIRTGAAALVGRPATVLERIVNHEGLGTVRIEGGEVWTARAFDEDETFEPGERVEVVEIRGATALVMH